MFTASISEPRRAANIAMQIQKMPQHRVCSLPYCSSCFSLSTLPFIICTSISEDAVSELSAAEIEPQEASMITANNNPTIPTGSAFFTK